jgi:hypothetical protein
MDAFLRYEVSFAGAAGRVSVDPFGCQVVSGAGPVRWAGRSPSFWRTLGAMLGKPNASSTTFQGQEAELIVSVFRFNGFCRAATCRWTARIGSTIARDGYGARRLERRERAVLLRAMRKLNVRYFRRHPGTCLIDGPVTSYRFRGFPLELNSCRHNLRGIEAVQIVDWLLATLKPARR